MKIAKSVGFNSPSRFISAGLRQHRIYLLLIPRDLPQESSSLFKKTSNIANREKIKGIL